MSDSKNSGPSILHTSATWKTRYLTHFFKKSRETVAKVSKNLLFQFKRFWFGVAHFLFGITPPLKKKSEIKSGLGGGFLFVLHAQSTAQENGCQL
jgi:hypothetical protein